MRTATPRGKRVARRRTPVARTRTAAPAKVEVNLTHPEKPMFPRDGITKQHVADYYAAVAPAMIATLHDRPIAVQHWPQGIHRPPWFQQNIGNDAAPWMSLVETPTSTSGRSVRHLLVDRPEALRWLAQHNVLTMHMWSSRRDSLDSPDWVAFDLDPADGHGFEQTLDVAIALRRWLEAHDIPSVPKTSGKRGLHVFVPLAPGHTHPQAVAWAVSVGDALLPDLPQATMQRAKNRRAGRLYFDCHQNGYGKTLVAPYSPRDLDGAPVSAPLEWREVTKRLDPMRFTIRTMPARLDRVGDLFAPALRKGIRLPTLR